MTFNSFSLSFLSQNGKRKFPLWTLHPLTRRRLRNRKNNKKARKTKNKSGIFIITSQGCRNGGSPFIPWAYHNLKAYYVCLKAFPFKNYWKGRKKVMGLPIFFHPGAPVIIYTKLAKSCNIFFLLIVKYKFAISSQYAYLKTNSLVLSYFQMNLHFCLSRSCCNYYVCQIDFLNKYVQ